MLSAQENIVVLELIYRLTKTEGLSSLCDLSNRFRELLEAEGLIFGLPTSDITEPGAIKEININYPKAWVEHYQDNQLWKVDPIVQFVKAKGGVISWSEAYKQDEQDSGFFHIAVDFEMRTGLTTMTNCTVGLAWSIISLSGDFSKNESRAIFLIDQLSHHFHCALSNYAKFNNNSNSKKHPLTNRELEVLKWFSQGKTSWEISAILNVSEATINFHGTNTCKKLHAVSRTQAVAIAMSLGIITL